MEELLVEWTLVRRLDMVKELFGDFLRKINASSLKLIGEQFSDENGRVDLIYAADSNNVILVELETSLSGKYDFALEQTKRYKKMNIHFPRRNTYSVILYASDVTPASLITKLQTDCQRENITPIGYEIKAIQAAYEKEVKILSENIGLVVEEKGIASVAPYSLASANKFLLAFKIANSDILSNKEIANAIPTPKGKRKGQPWASNTISTNLVVPEGFGLIERKKVGKVEKLRITDIGKKFISKYPFEQTHLTKSYLAKRQSEFPLTLEQKRILLEQLLKDEFGRMSRAKAMIFYFLKLVAIDPTLILPLHGKSHTNKMDAGDVKLCQRIFGTNWAEKPAATNVKNVIDWGRNYALELGLVEEIRISSGMKRVVMTSLGSRVHSLLELTQSLKREVIHIPQQISVPSEVL